MTQIPNTAVILSAVGSGSRVLLDDRPSRRVREGRRHARLYQRRGGILSVQPWGSAHGKTREHRFGEKLWYDPATGCIEWMGRLSTKGYGGFNFRVGSKRRAHRVAYEWMVGPIPDGLTIDHLCRNRRCVNPEHLEPVTNRENLMRGDGVAARNARKAECSRGHPFDDANTYHIPGKPWRKCRRCRADWEIKRRPRGDQD